VHYPLITWRLDIGTMGGYTPASRVMAWGMLLCLPVAVLLVVMARMLRQRGRQGIGD
jgi:apolipoprotein N-acyltransferase